MINTYVVPCRYGERGGAQRGRGGGGWSQGGGGGSGQWQDQSTFYEDDYSQDYSSDRYQVCTLLFLCVCACISLVFVPSSPWYSKTSNTLKLEIFKAH